MRPDQFPSSPTQFAGSAFATDGEVDEANLFLPDDKMPVIDEATLVEREAQTELDATLEELMREELPAAVELDQAEAEPDPVDSFEALLAESMIPVREAQQLKAAKEKLARGGMSRAEKLAIEAKVQEWETRRSWTVVANVMLNNRQVCDSCSAITISFSGLLQRQKHKVTANSRRWVASQKRDDKYPNEVAYLTTRTPICYACAETHGFPLLSGYHIDQPQGG